MRYHSGALRSPSLSMPVGGGCCRALAADLVLALLDGAVAIAAFFQVSRIHLRNPQVGWTRQKVFHVLVGFSSIGFVIYFTSTPFATCNEWLCWSRGCGFFLMACPQILLLAAFLLLLSFWVDLCHQANDEDDDEEEHGSYEVLLEKAKTKSGTSFVDNRRKCCLIPVSHIGSRQRIVAVVALLGFVFVMAFATIIWISDGTNHVDSLLFTTIYLDSISSVVLLLGGALACYGGVLVSKMSTVRSEMVSNEMWKVAGLAAVSLVCFSTSSLLALVTNAPVQALYGCQTGRETSRITSVLLFLYYLIGSCVPSAFVLWVMREIPPSHACDRPTPPRVVIFVRGKSSPTQDSQRWTDATTSANQVHKASPI